MKIGIPLTEDGTFSTHYGASAQLAIYDLDPLRQAVRGKTLLQPQTPEPCGWAEEVAAAGIELLLVGGMGGGAVARMASLGVQVLAGMPPAAPDQLAEACARGLLQGGANACEGGHDHGADQAHGHHHDGGCHCAH